MDLRSATAYFLTFHTYGTWLHGSSKGSVDALHNVFGSPVLMPDSGKEYANASRLKHNPVVFTVAQRASVDQAIREVADHRGWRVLALNVRTNHVHVVVSGNAAPERMLGDFKRWSTRRLREQGLVTEDLNVWSVHGSTRHLFDDKSVQEACDYTINRQ